MKTMIIMAICMITTTFYGQSTNEIELADRINNLVTNNIPALIKNDYFILDVTDSDTFIISKIDNKYTYYKLHANGNPKAEITSKPICTKPVLNGILTHFTPKAGVKKYMSEYGENGNKEYMLGTSYFAIYKNGIKTFDSYLPTYINQKSIESPIDDETLNFLYYYLVTNPDLL